MLNIVILLTMYICNLQINVYIYIIRSSSTTVNIGKKPEIDFRLNLLLLLNKKGSPRSLKLLVSLIQALYIPILLLSIARPI